MAPTGCSYRRELNEDTSPDLQESFHRNPQNAPSWIGNRQSSGRYAVYHDIVFKASDYDVSNTGQQNAVQPIRPSPKASSLKADLFRRLDQLHYIDPLHVNAGITANSGKVNPQFVTSRYRRKTGRATVGSVVLFDASV